MISAEHFKMDTLVKTLTLITQFSYFTSLDLMDTYLTLGVHPGFTKFLHFVWKDRLFQFISMPFWT